MPTSGGTTGTPISGGGAGLGGQGPGIPPTLLPLARYAQIMQVPLTHFHQMNGALAPLSGGCDKVWDQDARELLAWTMQQAEELIANELQFQPAPAFVTEEEIAFGLDGVRSDWMNGEVETKWKYIDDFGAEQLTLVQADAVVQYSDDDNDPLARPETATIGTSLYADLGACADPCDVAVFFRVADGAIDAADPRFEIRPIKVDIDGSTMHITAESSLFILPTLWNLTEAECRGSGDKLAWVYDFDTANLVAAVDVYCRTVNTQTPVTLQWDGVCSCTTSPCEHDTQTGCAYRTNKKLGFFVPRPATWNGSANVWAAPCWRVPPESVLVNYRAGYPLDSRTCQMNSNLERAIVKLTNVLLPEPPCGFCDAAQIRWENDRKPVDPLTPEAAALPWDLYAQGALEAWRLVKRLALGRGGKMPGWGG